MSDFQQMDIFFIIASVGFVIFIFVGIAIASLAIQLLKKLNSIADDAKAVSSDVREVSDTLRADVEGARTFVKGLFSFLKPKKKKK
jgi:hypothetical protein